MDLKYLIFIVCLGFVNQAWSVECTFSVTDAATKTTETKVFYDTEAVNVSTIRDFTAYYAVDVEKQIESVGLTLPSGNSSAPYYKLGALKKMGIIAKLENGDEASIICIR